MRGTAWIAAVGVVAGLGLACGGTAPIAAHRDHGAAPPRSLGEWDQDELARRAAALGWAVSDCTTDGDWGYREIVCTAGQADLRATLALTTYPDEESARLYDHPEARPVVRDGRTVLTAEISDGAAGERLADLMIPDPATIPADIGYFRSRVEPGGWTIENVSTAEDASGAWLSFYATKGDQHALVFVDLDRAYPLDGPRRSTSAGSVSVTSGRASVTVTVSDWAAARRVLADLMP